MVQIHPMRHSIDIPDRTDDTGSHLLMCDMGDTLIRWTHYDRREGLQALRCLCDHPRRFDLVELERLGGELDAAIEPRAAESLLEYRQADFLRLLFGRLGIQILCDDDHMEWLYWRAALAFQREPDVADALEELSAAGVTLAVVSNTPFGPRCVAGELERQGLDHFFVRPIVTSARFGVRKPDPAILRSAAALFTRDGEPVWYVGNSVYHDVGGAAAAGIPVIWYNEDGEDPSDHGPDAAVPDYTVSSWREVTPLIRSASARLGK